ncbi:MAG: cytochrome c [Bdellovibrionales bacterium]|nr:cytochrome c [Bdellovibrionales bacterium]
MKPTLGILSLTAFSALVAGCGYTRKNENYSQLATVGPHYSSIAANIVAPKCYPCHAPGGGAPDFTSYAGVRDQVLPGDPGGSGFYTEVEAGDMPIGRPMLSDDEILAIYQWIRNGAPND